MNQVTSLVVKLLDQDGNTFVGDNVTGSIQEILMAEFPTRYLA